MTLTRSKFDSTRIPGFSVMDRYITAELVLPFLFGVGLFASVGIAIGSLFDLVRKVTESGLPLGIALQALLLRMPQWIVYAFPMSMLLAALMAYSRLSSDSELTAIRSFGVSVYRLVFPAIIFSLLVTGLTFFFNEWLVPASNYQASVIVDRILDADKPTFKERNIFYPEYTKVEQPDGDRETVLTYLFYAEQYDGEKMQGLTVLDRSQIGVSRIVTSESATWNIKENTWDFFNGTIYFVAPDGSYSNILRFERQQLQLPRAPLDLAEKGRDFNEMSIMQARERLEVVKYSGSDKKIRKLKVRIQEKIAFPFLCLVVGLVGAALGCKPQQTGRATSFGISVLVIFSYYLLIFMTSRLGLLGVLSPFMAAWLPNFIGLGVAAMLLYRSSLLAK